MSEKLFGGVLNDPVPAPTCHICGQHGGHAFDCHDDREDARIRALSTPTAHDALIAEARGQLEAWNYKGHLDDWRGAEMKLCAVIKRLADALTAEQAARVKDCEHAEKLAAAFDAANRLCETWKVEAEENADLIVKAWAERDALRTQLARLGPVEWWHMCQDRFGDDAGYAPCECANRKEAGHIAIRRVLPVKESPNAH